MSKHDKYKLKKFKNNKIVLQELGFKYSFSKSGPACRFLREQSVRNAGAAAFFKVSGGSAAVNAAACSVLLSEAKQTFARRSDKTLGLTVRLLILQSA